MKKDLLIKGIFIPLAIALALGVAFFLFTLSPKTTFVAPKEMAYFTTEKQAVGELSFGDKKLDVVKNGDASDLAGALLLDSDNDLSSVGVKYLYTYALNLDGIGDKDKISITVDGKTYTYNRRYTFQFDNLYELPLRSVDANNGIVIYYEKSIGYGYSSQYEAIVFEEVA